MPTWLERFSHYVAYCAAPGVQRSATNCTSTVTQCADPMKSMIFQDADTAGGVCESLSAHWIKYHAEGDSLWNWLCDGNGMVKAGPVWDVMHVQRRGMNGGPGQNQNVMTDRYLRENGIQRLPTNRGRVMMNGAMRAYAYAEEYQGRTGFFSAQDLGNDIIRDATTAGGRTGGQYKKIGISGRMGAHAMAAWVAEDVAFYDPNFGEFWFETKQQFVAWFNGEFWRRSLYCAGLSGEYDICTYGKVA